MPWGISRRKQRECSNISKDDRYIQKTIKRIANVCSMCYSPNYQVCEDKNMNIFFMNSLRRRERRRKLL